MADKSELVGQLNDLAAEVEKVNGRPAWEQLGLVPGLVVRLLALLSLLVHQVERQRLIIEAMRKGE